MKRILFIIKYIDYNDKICYLKDSVIEKDKDSVMNFIITALFCDPSYDKIKKIIGVKYKVINQTYNIDAFLYDNMYEDL